MSSFLELTMFSTLKGHHDYVKLFTLLRFISIWADLHNLTGNYLSSTLPFTLHNDNNVELYIIIGTLLCPMGSYKTQGLKNASHRGLTTRADREKRHPPGFFVKGVQRCANQAMGF
jgi:hypothetical protein